MRRGQLPPALPSSISRWRAGSLSMERTISRTCHGSGLRRYISPSLPMSTRPKPRGRSFCRQAERDAGSVSVITTTSRVTSASSRSVMYPICSTYRGSAGVSANTTSGRLSQRNSSGATSCALTMSGTSPSDAVSCAAAETAAKARKTRANSGFIRSPARQDIGVLSRNAKPDWPHREKTTRLIRCSGFAGTLRPATGQQGTRAIMDITLHFGAHRTATTSLQRHAQARTAALAAHGLAFWGPPVTRDGLLAGVVPAPGEHPEAARTAHARGRIALRVAQAQQAGATRIVVSDENMLGAPRTCLRRHRLYPGAGARVARLAHAFGGRITGAVLSIRSQDAWWASVLAYSVARGHRLPSPGDLDRLVTAGRQWRDVISDIACALPGADIVILPHERFAACPGARLCAMTGVAAAEREAGTEWRGRGPDLPALRRAVTIRGGDATRLPGGEGRWQPFDAAQAAALKGAYGDDLSWLRAGADGLARLAGETGPTDAETQPCGGQPTRGQDNDIEERHLA